MRTWVACFVVASSGVAVARPLPKGLVISIKNDALVATRDGITVPAQDPAAAAADQFIELQSATLSDDGKDLVIRAGHCKGEGADDPEPAVTMPLAALDARFENAIGMQLHLKKKYTDAIAHFTIAAKQDPDAAMYATNLLSAQSMAKLLDDADHTIATYGASHRPWFAWRLQADPELANLRGRASAKAMFAPTPTKLTWANLGNAIATSPLGLIAVDEWMVAGGPGAPGGDELVIYDLDSSVVLRLPVVAHEDACNEMYKCTKQHTRTPPPTRAWSTSCSGPWRSSRNRRCGSTLPTRASRRRTRRLPRRSPPTTSSRSSAARPRRSSICSTCRSGSRSRPRSSGCSRVRTAGSSATATRSAAGPSSSGPSSPKLEGPAKTTSMKPSTGRSGGPGRVPVVGRRCQASEWALHRHQSWRPATAFWTVCALIEFRPVPMMVCARNVRNERTLAVDEEALIAWQDVLDTVAAGRPHEAGCPFCNHRPLTIEEVDNSTRISCSKCKKFIQGRFQP